MDMRRQVRSKRERERRTSLVLMAVAAVVLFAGLFAQISIRARISGQAKQISAVRQEIQALSANAENLSLCINQYQMCIRDSSSATVSRLQKEKEQR